MPEDEKKTAGPRVSFDTPQELFKHHFVMMMADLGANAQKDPETIFLIGSLAGHLVEDSKKTSWAETKASLSRDAYDSILKTFQDQANLLAAKGSSKAAYAIEVLALSVIAPTMRADEHIASGNILLDNMIEDTIKIYRQRTKKKPS